MKYARTAIAFILFLAACSQAFAEPASSVALYKNGQPVASGVYVGGGRVLTAEHVIGSGAPDAMMLDGKLVPLRTAKDAERNYTDDAVLMDVQSAAVSIPASIVAKFPPKVGDRVTTIGFPSGKTAYLEGHVTRVSAAYREQKGNNHDAAYCIETDILTQSGHSGGPLWNESGELIGLCSATAMRGPQRILPSLWVGVQSIQGVLATTPHVAAIDPNKPDLIVFSGDPCAPCEPLKDDIARGAYSDWNVIIVEWNYVTKRWSVPWQYVNGKRVDVPELSGEKLTAEFSKYTKVKGTVPTPTLWARYTDYYKSGNQGIGTWLKGIILFVQRELRNLLFGEPPPSLPPSTPFVAPQEPEEGGDPERYDRSLESSVEGLKSEVAKVRSLAEDAASRAKSLKDDNVFAKGADLIAIKRDVEGVRKSIPVVKSHVQELRDGFSDPKSWPGILLGLYGWYRRRRDAA